MRIANEAKELMLNPPFIGKPVYLYLRPSFPTCATHFCENCPPGFVNCAQEEGPSSYCQQMGVSSRRSWINHYSFQSKEHWELKKLVSKHHGGGGGGYGGIGGYTGGGDGGGVICGGAGESDLLYGGPEMNLILVVRAIEGWIKG